MGLPSEKSTRLTNVQLSMLRKLRDAGHYKPKPIEEQSVRKLQNYRLVNRVNGMLSLTPRGQEVLNWYEQNNHPGEIRYARRYLG